MISSVADSGPLGGWIAFPGGEFTRDPASLRNSSGYHGPSYDRAIGSWVPVEYQNVAPDGLTYVLYHDATTEVPNAFYLVDAKTGSQRLILPTPLPPTQGSEWKVIEYASEGIYLWAPSVGMAKAVPGLWLLDPLTGRVTLINGQYYWRIISGASAWALDPWTGPDNYGFPPSRIGGYKVYRLDLLTGKVNTWYSSQTPIQLLSATPDGGLLINYGVHDKPRLAVLEGPGVFSPLAIAADFPPIWDARSTRPGVWIGLYGAIALYVKGEGVRIVARNPDVNGLYYAAGGCW